MSSCGNDGRDGGAITAAVLALSPEQRARAAEIGCRYQEVQRRIQEAASRSGRSASHVNVLAVTKGFPADALRAVMAAGLVHLGENYAQEWSAKADLLGASEPPPIWHFIGRLQTNKARMLAPRVAWVHSADRPSVIDALGRAWQRVHAPLRVLIQVSMAGEPQKGGCDPGHVGTLVSQCLRYPSLQPRGLMTVAPDVDDPEDARPYFAGLAALLARVRQELPPQFQEDFRELSMGMSHDFEVAVEEGATWIRLGTALVGPRAAL